jgi:hypothetical protein
MKKSLSNKFSDPLNPWERRNFNRVRKLSAMNDVFSVIYINRAKRFRQAFHSAKDKVARFSMWKLFANIISFGVLFMGQLVLSFLIVVLSFTRQNCILGRPSIGLLMTLFVITRTMLLLRVIVDAIASFFIDYQVRQCENEVINRSNLTLTHLTHCTV